ncbi:poly(ADP-ribose) glycohydrolase 1-like isoform X2 [Telopea speciosissima]|uniref:poly(ADP-ribose) glycohydrolase 1-like isoform X2 n=1 Tax=Telopea speciosissima TaxID=54955 RepID=UPI001CC6749F|nr:poly(ADP-ribose) glycohydrolase 1-like isoform X2 [Telopea speciosissima]
MEKREELISILPFLPVVLQSSSLLWPSQVVEGLKALSRGPEHSEVDSGEVLFLAISDLRDSLCLSESLAVSAAEGYALFFDELMSRVESRKWFSEVLPSLAALLLRLPSLLDIHYQNADNLLGGVKTGLRIIGPQEAGIVFLSQELIGALITCSFFCLFPITNRDAEDLPDINFNHLFASIYTNYSESQEHKIKCIIHYFERISSCMPTGCVSFERKLLSGKHVPFSVSYPDTEFWSKSAIPLCHFEVSHSGLIEDQLCESLEVDFANKYIGGGALRRGCVQEEIRFVINPELIAGMLFLPCMADNEAIEIFGAERFSNYTGYASSFHFVGDYVDEKPVDFMGRQKTRIVAIDALCSPGMRQYRPECLLRETNKAFCGFFDQSKQHLYQETFQVEAFCGDKNAQEFESHSGKAGSVQMDRPLSSPEGLNDGASIAELINKSHIELSRQSKDPQDDIGIVTGNWGCGAFGGDPELKSIIQWLAASQAFRPFILYCTFGEETLRNMEQVTQWILLHEWTIGDLWNMLSEYSSQRLKRKTNTGFFTWLLPS